LPFFFADFLEVFFFVIFFMAMCCVHLLWWTLTPGMRLKAAVLRRALEDKVGPASWNACQAAGEGSETVRLQVAICMRLGANVSRTDAVRTGMRMEGLGASPSPWESGLAATYVCGCQNPNGTPEGVPLPLRVELPVIRGYQSLLLG
jgi:hypothetical protein